ncbi:MAG: T9SS type A sorting domain-containing protein [Cyclobacteriaceae bacterium]|nr:T9SS type A sorting domain-containing protein [Cyclobacteriaceae bacterium]
MKKIFFKTIIVCLFLFTVTVNAQNQNFPHIKTFGYDYVPLNNRLDLAQWLAQHHDWIIGGGGDWDATLYNTVKEANSNTKIMSYLAYHSISPDDMAWMENWCSNNGFNPEDIYYHYHTDTQVKILNGTYITVPGYGNGSATTLAEARARVRWNGGWPGINPSSTAFRRAFEVLAVNRLTVSGLTDTYLDGLFLDTFDGIANDGNWTSRLENTIELNPNGTISKEDVYTVVRQDLIDAKMELEAFLKQTINNSFVINVNAADIDMIYNWFSYIYMDYRDETMHVSIEYLITSTSNTNRIPRLVQVYDDMENGREFFIRSQTNFAPPTEIPFGFTQFILSTHYLVNHPNAHFMYHYGNAGNYGGYPYGNFEPTHWHQNIEINIGTPIVRSTVDYWGETNTDRFYEFANGTGYQILAREYTNALVLTNFGGGGWANIGNNPTTHQLDGEYYPLLDDNTNAPAVTSITLGQSEGVILLKSPVGTLNVNEVTENEINIYPNPVKNILTINNKGQLVESYKIYNTIGQVIQSDSSFNESKINISHLNSGVYFLKILLNQKETTVKFIKK